MIVTELKKKLFFKCHDNIDLILQPFVTKLTVHIKEKRVMWFYKGETLNQTINQ